MALLRAQHCGRDEPHAAHNGRWVHHLAGPGPHLICDGDPAHLARQREREANPPPGPPNPPQRIEWTNPTVLTGVSDDA